MEVPQQKNEVIHCDKAPSCEVVPLFIEEFSLIWRIWCMFINLPLFVIHFFQNLLRVKLNHEPTKYVQIYQL